MIVGIIAELRDKADDIEASGQGRQALPMSPTGQRRANPWKAWSRASNAAGRAGLDGLWLVGKIAYDAARGPRFDFRTSNGIMR